MRIIGFLNKKDEKIVTCPNCKSVIDFNKKDEQNQIINHKAIKYIKCPKCGSKVYIIE